MPKAKRKKIYESLPLIYDHLMRRIRYDYWADYLFQVTSKYISTKASVLELAAGNCKLAEFMIKKYPDLIVSDLSAEMLARAESKYLKRICFDMLSPPVKKQFELIYITFDSINYLLTKKNISLFFSKIKELLDDEGIFTFDASLEKNSLSHTSQPIRKARYNGYNYVHKSSYNKKTRIHKNVFNIIFPGGIVYEEVHKQKILKYYDYFDLLEKAGLYVVECFDAFTFKDGKPNSKRVQFIVKKMRN